MGILGIVVVVLVALILAEEEHGRLQVLPSLLSYSSTDFLALDPALRRYRFRLFSSHVSSQVVVRVVRERTGAKPPLPLRQAPSIATPARWHRGSDNQFAPRLHQPKGDSGKARGSETRHPPIIEGPRANRRRCDLGSARNYHRPLQLGFRVEN